MEQSADGTIFFVVEQTGREERERERDLQHSLNDHWNRHEIHNIIDDSSTQSEQAREKYVSASLDGSDNKYEKPEKNQLTHSDLRLVLMFFFQYQ